MEVGLDRQTDGSRVETQLPGLVTAPASARAFLRSALETWKLDGFAAVTELLTDELVSNVVRHVGAPMTIRAIWRPASLRIEVDDPSTDAPTLHAPDPFATSGRGITFVDSLADRWGTRVGNAGKTVWFELDVDTENPAVHDA
jgi:anti-sigma regulatory factor (Ser/Thr protein kinase)